MSEQALNRRDKISAQKVHLGLGTYMTCPKPAIAGDVEIAEQEGRRGGLASAEHIAVQFMQCGRWGVAEQLPYLLKLRLNTGSPAPSEQ